jgi:hypothetical protein
MYGMVLMFTCTFTVGGRESLRASVAKVYREINQKYLQIGSKDIAGA